MQDYREGRTGKGLIPPILSRLKQHVSDAQPGQVTIPCLGHWNISLHLEQLKTIGYPHIPIQTLTKGRACYVTLTKPRVNKVKINLTKLHVKLAYHLLRGI